ncbi:hypothetical protein DPEC_G00211080 [Dallia pectoralis]|uniref:Uncharacterized protein n=1 Tax=Dallia pectoralis TaxID=75939 RepID=A0ACC2G624_DALPE|nr:hypothetical protein DPEC_G00211080 [Dallia pectoralis]
MSREDKLHRISVASSARKPDCTPQNIFGGAMQWLEEGFLLPPTLLPSAPASLPASGAEPPLHFPLLQTLLKMPWHGLSCYLAGHILACSPDVFLDPFSTLI